MNTIFGFMKRSFGTIRIPGLNIMGINVVKSVWICVRRRINMMCTSPHMLVNAVMSRRNSTKQYLAYVKPAALSFRGKIRRGIAAKGCDNAIYAINNGALFSDMAAAMQCSLPDAQRLPIGACRCAGPYGQLVYAYRTDMDLACAALRHSYASQIQLSIACVACGGKLRFHAWGKS